MRGTTTTKMLPGPIVDKKTREMIPQDLVRNNRVSRQGMPSRQGRIKKGSTGNSLRIIIRVLKINRNTAEVRREMLPEIRTYGNSLTLVPLVVQFESRQL